MTTHGLKLLPKDERDFRLGTLYPKVEVPDTDFLVGILRIKDQGGTMFCTAFAVTTISEFQEGIELSPEYQAAKINQLGINISTEGSDLRTAIKSLIKFGSLEYSQAPYNLSNRDPYFIGDYHNWPTELDFFAKKHAKKSFVSID